jgi:hypothetical protein
VLQDAVRKHANKMMGRTRNDKAEEAINKYKSPWNIRLADILVDNYVQGGCPFAGVKDISAYFFTYLRSLPTNHRNRTGASPTEEEQCTTIFQSATESINEKLQ